MKRSVKVLIAVVGLIGLLVILLDIKMSRRQGSVLDTAMVPILTAPPEGLSVVAIATSADTELAEPVALDTSPVSYRQVDAVVRRALELDTSDTRLTNVIGPDDWVIVKINLVCAPLTDSTSSRTNRGFYNNDIQHWGDVTDARVVKSVVTYLVETVGPKRISLVEGSGTWAVAGKFGQGGVYDNSFDVDGWTVHWREFDNICYLEMCEELTNSQERTLVDYVDLNEDEYRFVPVPGGAFQFEGCKFRDGKRFTPWSPIPGTGKRREGYYMPATMLDADKLVNIPAMKMNGGGGTLIFKNYVGAFASIPYGDGLSKRQMDNFSFAHGMVDIFSYKPTVYGVIGGFWASERDWPRDTLNCHNNIVIAGGDPLAVEATTLRAMGVNPRDVVQTHLALAKGFGHYDERDIRVVGTPVRDVRRNFIKHSAFRGLGFQTFLMHGPHKADDLDTDLLGGEPTIAPTEGMTTAGSSWWTFRHPWGYPEAYVSLNENCDVSLTETVTYAYLGIESFESQQGTLVLGFDDGVKVFLNGREVYKDDGSREYKYADVRVPVTLDKGMNRLLIKLRNRYGEAGFSCSIVDDSETRMYDIRVVVPGGPAMVQASAAR